MSKGRVRALAVYLSSTTARATEMQRYATELSTAGFLVVSRWPWAVGEVDMAAAAARDIDDLSTADVLVAFTQGTTAAHQGRGGRHVELGIGIVRDLSVLIVGEREHAFHHLPSVMTAPDWQAAQPILAQLASQGS